jgi:hypothetical protein
MLAERLAQRRDVYVEIAFFDDAPGPQPSHQFVLADQLALSRSQRTQNVEGAAVAIRAGRDRAGNGRS